MGHPAIEAGMDAYLSKPIRSKELFETIEGLIGEGSVKPATVEKAPATNSAIFNEALLLDRTEGNAEICSLLVQTFLKECPAHINGLRQAMQQKDAKQLAAIAHGLKGAVANFTEGPALEATKSAGDDRKTK